MIRPAECCDSSEIILRFYDVLLPVMQLCLIIRLFYIYIKLKLQNVISFYIIYFIVHNNEKYRERVY